MTKRSVAVFDLGGVLIDWNPRYLYRKLFAGDEHAMEYFLATVCSSNWNAQQDAGRPLADACALLKSKHPNYSKMIDAWVERYGEMLGGPIQGTVELLAELRSTGAPIYALSNWSTETFPAALERFDFLRWFDGILLSGEVRLLKPDPRIYRRFSILTPSIRRRRFTLTISSRTSQQQRPLACTAYTSPAPMPFAAS